MTPAGYYYASNNFFTSEHGGTHIDAPVHFAQGRQTVDEIPLDRSSSAARRRSTSPRRPRRDADYQVSVADFKRWEQQHGAIPRGRDRAAADRIRAALARRRTLSRHGRTRRGGGGQAAFSRSASRRRAVARRQPRRSRRIGIDTASIDYGQSTLYESHRALYERNIPAFENLASLERLPPTGAIVVALPMKIKGGSGAPLRAIAILPQ